MYRPLNPAAAEIRVGKPTPDIEAAFVLITETQGIRLLARFCMVLTTSTGIRRDAERAARSVL